LSAGTAQTTEPRGRCALRLGQRLVLAQDRPLELLQRRPGLDPELIDEQLPPGPVGLERLGLPPGAVEREHQLGARPLA